MFPVFRLLVFWLCSILVPTAAASCATISLELNNCSIPGSSVDSWGASLSFSKSSQSVCLVPSTVTNTTFLLGSDFCQNWPNGTSAQCESLCGNTFSVSAAGKSYNITDPNVTSALNPTWLMFSSNPFLAGNTSLYLPANRSISQFPIALITEGNSQNVGHLGLATRSQLLKSAIDHGLINQEGFGLNSGSQAVGKPRPGMLVLGGYDQASIAPGPWSTFAIGDRSSTDRPCPFQVTIKQILLRYPNAVNYTDIVISSVGVLLPTCIEPYDNLIRLPQTPLQNIKTATNWSSTTKPNSSILIVEPGLYYNQGQGINASLVIQLDDGSEWTIPNEELFGPVRGIDTDGDRVLDANVTQLNVFASIAQLETVVLGKVFLSQAYLIGDYSPNINKFSLAKVSSNPGFTDIVPLDATSATCLSTTGPPNSTGSTSRHSLTNGDKIGIGIGVPGLVIGALILAFVAKRYWQQRRSRRSASGFPVDRNTNDTHIASKQVSKQNEEQVEGPLNTLPGPRTDPMSSQRQSDPFLGSVEHSSQSTTHERQPTAEPRSPVPTLTSPRASRSRVYGDHTPRDFPSPNEGTSHLSPTLWINSTSGRGDEPPNPPSVDLPELPESPSEGYSTLYSGTPAARSGY